MGMFSVFGRSNILYFPGCTTYFKFRENFELYKKIFYKLGINFKTIDKKVCSGLPAFEAGYEQEARKLARRNFEIFKEEGVLSIITNSPGAYKVFLQNYPEFLPDWNIKVENIWKIILSKLESKPKLIKFKALEIVTYHDSCYLGRYCGIYGEPRRILELIGYQIDEMEDTKERSFCCGSCGGVERINPDLADKIAKQRLLQAKRTGVKKLIVSSMENYQLLKRNAEEVGIEVLEFSEVLALALGIKRKFKEDEEEVLGERIGQEEQIILNTEE